MAPSTSILCVICHRRWLSFDSRQKAVLQSIAQDRTQARPLATSSLTQARPLATSSLTQARPLATSSLTQARPLATSSLTQARPLATSSLTQARPLATFSLTQARLLATALPMTCLVFSRFIDAAPRDGMCLTMLRINCAPATAHESDRSRSPLLIGILGCTEIIKRWLLSSLNKKAKQASFECWMSRTGTLTCDSHWQICSFQHKPNF